MNLNENLDEYYGDDTTDDESDNYDADSDADSDWFQAPVRQPREPDENRTRNRHACQ